jgi:hypothetical protein
LDFSEAFSELSPRLSPNFGILASKITEEARILLALAELHPYNPHTGIMLGLEHRRQPVVSGRSVMAVYVPGVESDAKARPASKAS